MGEVTSDGGEVGGGVGGGHNHRNPCFMNWTALRGEACGTPSSSPNGGEISGLYSTPFLPSFL